MSRTQVRFLLGGGVPVLLLLVAGLIFWLGFAKDSVSSPLESSRQASPKDPRQQEVKDLIVRYFRTWSEQDMKGYDSCFMPEACIQYIDRQGGLLTTPRKTFVEEQTDYHRTALHKATEAPETIDIRFEEKLARVVVFWKLVAGKREETGYDHFTLIKHEGKWRIVNLVFYVSR